MLTDQEVQRLRQVTGGPKASVLDGYIQAALQGILANPTSFAGVGERMMLGTPGKVIFDEAVAAAVNFGAATFKAATEYINKERGKGDAVEGVHRGEPLADAPQVPPPQEEDGAVH